MSGFGVFGDVQNALAPFVGNADVAGYVLWLIVSAALFVAFMVLFWEGRRAPDVDGVFIFAAGIGTGFSFGVGWIPVAIPIFIGFLIIFVIIGLPGASRRG